MNSEVQQVSSHFLAPPEVPTVALYLIAALFVAAWVKLHRWQPAFAVRWPAAALFVLRVLVGFLTLSAAVQALQRHLVFANNWALWPILLTGALATETVLLLYALERQAVPARQGRILVGLRVSIILLLVLMLCQPVQTFEISRKIDRHVAILLDSSASMRLNDTGMLPAEKVRLAEFLSLGNVRRPYRYDEISRLFRQVRQELAAQADGLVALSQLEAAARQQQLARRRSAIDEALRRLQKTVAVQATSLAEPLAAKNLKLDDATKAQITELTAKLKVEVLDRLEATLQLLNVKLPAEVKAEKDKPQPPPPSLEYDRILDGVRRAFAFLQEAEPRLVPLGNALDSLCYDALPAADKKAVDTVTTTKRLDLARQVLTHAPKIDLAGQKAGTSLLDLLQENYGLKICVFAAGAAETTMEKLERERKAAVPDESQDPTAQNTDITVALQKAMTDIPSDQLAGILLFTDGRHNTPDPVEPIARRLGQLQIPVCPIVFGAGERPPADAAIIAVDAPDTVYAGDRFCANVDVKLDSCTGKNVIINLLDGATVVDSQTVTCQVENLRKRLQLADKPKANGFHAYKIVIQPVEGEVSKNNNEYFLPVNVTDDRIKLLIVEGRPRWEFRYLKNLFASRDQSVKLQYVLIHPDQVTDLPPPPKVAASAARPVEEVEATELPASPEEWMKFDVIMLGDVEPAALTRSQVAAMRKFVADRGGTLVVVAGPLYMPHSYTQTPLAELLPVQVMPGDKPVMVGPEPSYRMALTQEGQEHVITRLAVSPEENLKLWRELPPIYWRHPIRDTKAGATVLAFAQPSAAAMPDFLRPATSTEVPEEDVLRRRRQYERENALVVSHNFAHGRVLFLAMDHTWRLRYRTGDTYHHRFWGQLLRWATADKLLYGSGLVKLGTDHARYTPDDSVRVRAKIVRPDFSPVTNANPMVTVFQGDKNLLRKRMRFVTDSAGVYSADLGKLPEGQYRVELESDALAAEVGEAGKGTLKAGFGVSRILPVELLELAADRGLLNRVANLTNGLVAEPTQAATALERLGPPSLIQKERRQFDIWNSWPFLLLIVALAAAEWALRKKVSLP